MRTLTCRRVPPLTSRTDRCALRLAGRREPGACARRPADAADDVEAVREPGRSSAAGRHVRGATTRPAVAEAAAGAGQARRGPADGRLPADPAGHAVAAAASHHRRVVDRSEELVQGMAWRAGGGLTVEKDEDSVSACE